MALVARDEKLEPALTGTYLCVPELVSSHQKLPDKYQSLWLSRVQNKAAPILDQPFLDFIKGKRLALLSSNFEASEMKKLTRAC